MKGIIEFNLDEMEDKERFRKCLDADEMYLFLWEIEQRIFRPARKHGYSGDFLGSQLNTLLDQSDDAAKAISLLEQLYYDLKNDRFNYE